MIRPSDYDLQYNFGPVMLEYDQKKLYVSRFLQLVFVMTSPLRKLIISMAERSHHHNHHHHGHGNWGGQQKPKDLEWVPNSGGGNNWSGPIPDLSWKPSRPTPGGGGN